MLDSSRRAKLVRDVVSRPVLLARFEIQQWSQGWGSNVGPDVSFIHADLTMDEVMRVWPETLRAFLQRRMACIGCAIAPFHTLAEAALIYGVPEGELLAEARLMASRITPRRPGGPAPAGQESRSAAALPSALQPSPKR